MLFRIINEAEISHNFVFNSVCAPHEELSSSSVFQMVH